MVQVPTKANGMPGKNAGAVIPRPQISASSTYEEIIAKQQQSEYYATSIPARKLFYRKIEAGERRRIRFLADFDDNLKLIVHNRYAEGATDNLFDVVCHSMYGLPCPYCKGGVKQEAKYAWPVWLFPSEAEALDNVQEGRFAIFMFKHSKLSPVGKLTEFYADEDYGTLLEHDWTFKRTGKGMTDTVYTVTPKARSSKVNTDNVPIPSKEKMLELATLATNIPLYKILEEYGIPDGDDTWTKNEEVEVQAAADDDDDDVVPAPRVPKAQVGASKTPAGKKKPAQKVTATRPADAEGTDDEDDEFTPEDLQRLIDEEDEDSDDE